MQLKASTATLAGLIIAASLGVGCTKQASKTPAGFQAATKGLQVKTLSTGTGKAVESGDEVIVHYTGWLYDKSKKDFKGKEFDSSIRADRPFTFVLGRESVIKGWDKGVVGMKIGEKRTLIVSPEMGYGDRGVGPIPANSTLIFDVQLLSFNKTKARAKHAPGDGHDHGHDH